MGPGAGNGEQDGGGAFLDNARNILTAAENVLFSTGALDETSILIAREGGIRVVCGGGSGSDWSLESLRAHHGAQMAYRVSQRDGRVHLEGRAGSRTCLFEAEKPNGAALLLLANTRHYDLDAAARRNAGGGRRLHWIAQYAGESGAVAAAGGMDHRDIRF